jgi:hypothetical protein
VLALLLDLMSSNCSAVRVPAIGSAIEASSSFGAITAAQNRAVATRRIVAVERGVAWDMAGAVGVRGLSDLSATDGPMSLGRCGIGKGSFTLSLDDINRCSTGDRPNARILVTRLGLGREA